MHGTMARVRFPRYRGTSSGVKWGGAGAAELFAEDSHNSDSNGIFKVGEAGISEIAPQELRARQGRNTAHASRGRRSTQNNIQTRRLNWCDHGNLYRATEGTCMVVPNYAYMLLASQAPEAVLAAQAPSQLALRLVHVSSSVAVTKQRQQSVSLAP